MFHVTNIMDSKSFIGIFGTALTVMLENISVVVSIMVGLATLAYMTEKWYQMRKNRLEDKEEE